MADSVLGSLCREADCIWHRLIDIRRSQQRCCNVQLLGRLQSEFDSLSGRCAEIQQISSLLKSQGDANSLVLEFLDEIIRRTILVANQRNIAQY